jgi:gamma-glutamylcyclotransferase (GGCT)/AIG2-like uncharacterized protein YtfP
MAELLAVYGTLMSGQDYEGRPDVETLLRHRGPCRIRGGLYSEGDYPWLVVEEGEVAGELYELPAKERDETLALLDAYENEGRHTEHGAGRYERRLLRLIEPDVDAWVYVWDGPQRGQRLDSDDWRTFLALRGDR